MTQTLAVQAPATTHFPELKKRHEPLEPLFGLSRFATENVQNLHDECLAAPTYGADDYILSLNDAMHYSGIFPDGKKKQLTFPDRAHVQAAKVQVNILIEKTKNVRKKKFQPHLLPKGVKLPLKFSDSIITCEKRDFDYPMDCLSVLMEDLNKCSDTEGPQTIIIDPAAIQKRQAARKAKEQNQPGKSFDVYRIGFLNPQNNKPVYVKKCITANNQGEISPKYILSPTGDEFPSKTKAKRALHGFRVNANDENIIIDTIAMKLEDMQKNGQVFGINHSYVEYVEHAEEVKPLGKSGANLKKKPD
jgi:hypothetical protein